MGNTNQTFRYTTVDLQEHTLDISVLHMAQAERELEVSVTEWAGRLEPELLSAFKAWQDNSIGNRGFFELWCDSIVAIEGQRTYATIGSREDSEPTEVSMRVLVEAERMFGQSYISLCLNSLLNFRMFVVWRACVPGGQSRPTMKAFDKWLSALPADFECDVWIEKDEEDNDENPKVL